MDQLIDAGSLETVTSECSVSHPSVPAAQAGGRLTTSEFASTLERGVLKAMLSSMKPAALERSLACMQADAARIEQGFTALGIFERLTYAHIDPKRRIRSGIKVVETRRQPVRLIVEQSDDPGEPPALRVILGGPTGLEGCLLTQEFLDELIEAWVVRDRAPYVLSMGNPGGFERFSIEISDLVHAIEAQAPGLIYSRSGGLAA